MDVLKLEICINEMLNQANQLLISVEEVSFSVEDLVSLSNHGQTLLDSIENLQEGVSSLFLNNDPDGIPVKYVERFDELFEKFNKWVSDVYRSFPNEEYPIDTSLGTLDVSL